MVRQRLANVVDPKWCEVEVVWDEDEEMGKKGKIVVEVHSSRTHVGATIGEWKASRRFASSLSSQGTGVSLGARRVELAAAVGDPRGERGAGPLLTAYQPRIAA